MRLRLAALLFAAVGIATGQKYDGPRPPKPEVQLATDLPAQTVDIILGTLQQRGAPAAERIPGLGLGASALAAEGSRNVHETADAGRRADQGGDPQRCPAALPAAPGGDQAEEDFGFVGMDDCVIESLTIEIHLNR